jgi:hypothetical protein
MATLDIAHQRLHNQYLTQTPFTRPREVVDWLMAVQAQDYFGAQWALGLRLRQTAHDTDIDRAFAEGSILRTHVMRPTWHFVTPADIRWLLALTAPRVHAVNAHRYRDLELDDATLKRSHKALIKALQGGQHLTREELGESLETVGVTAKGQRLAYIVMHAELDGLICSGPRRGKQFTYALLEERVPPVATLKRDESLAKFARRYFVSHGPATVQDFAKWSGLTIADAKRGLEDAKHQLQHETVNGEEYWFSSAAAPVRRAAPTTYLLSIYDEYIIGYKDRSMIASAEIAAKLFTMGAALTYVVVIDKHIVGGWRRTLNKEAVTIEINPFRRFTMAEQRSIAAAAQRYGEFLGMQAVINKPSDK